MFDLIDDFSKDLWVDKGSPPEDLNTIEGYQVYDIVKREVDKENKTVMYYLHDPDNVKSKKAIAEGITVTYDPLRNIRHCHAKVEVVEGDNPNKILGLLTDSDWIERK